MPKTARTQSLEDHHMGVMVTEKDERSTTVWRVNIMKMMRTRSLLVELTTSKKELRLKVSCMADAGLPTNLLKDEM